VARVYFKASTERIQSIFLEIASVNHCRMVISLVKHELILDMILRTVLVEPDINKGDAFWPTRRAFSPGKQFVQFQKH